MWVGGVGRGYVSSGSRPPTHDWHPINGYVPLHTHVKNRDGLAVRCAQVCHVTGCEQLYLTKDRYRTRPTQPYGTRRRLARQGRHASCASQCPPCAAAPPRLAVPVLCTHLTVPHSSRTARAGGSRLPRRVRRPYKATTILLLLADPPPPPDIDPPACRAYHYAWSCSHV